MGDLHMFILLSSNLSSFVVFLRVVSIFCYNKKYGLLPDSGRPKDKSHNFLKAIQLHLFKLCVEMS